MSQTTTANDLLKLVSKLQTERDGHVKAIEEIDSTFEQLGMKVTPATTTKKRRGRPAGTSKKAKATKASAKKPTKRGRGAFAVTGEESVLGFVKATAGCTTAQVNEHWVKEGRSGQANNALGKLVKEGKIARKNLKGQRGSTYTAK